MDANFFFIISLISVFYNIKMIKKYRLEIIIRKKKKIKKINVDIYYDFSLIIIEILIFFFKKKITFFCNSTK